ncbi:related to UFD4 - Ubiquitin-protein ligase (E3) [Melanopsichium pennsylvanicum]|uniref:HECT-type E3 ubiquitin transferase n=2 Tax=Melanopsichium pennsylvanicum TaxID=63383 RepID=A0AAJ5C7N9_9BASI|nr:related to UFD4-Ubiquitin-protein ligase (E3) [Melanopsichium pennsylvanicum 4]SNX87121.1 related to UFD4 - Ubiquitin-protein ligase (E3) [Melanopsichium pennsylvanicum]
MPGDRTRAKSSSPSKARSTPRSAAGASSSARSSSSTTSSVATNSTHPSAESGSSRRSNASLSLSSPSAAAAVKTSLRRSRRLSTAVVPTDESSDSPSDTSFHSYNELSAPVTPATVASTSASNPSSASRKSQPSPCKSPATRSSTLAPQQSTPSRVGTSSDSTGSASKSIGRSKRKAKPKASSHTTAADASSSIAPPSASAIGKRKATSTTAQQTPKTSSRRATASSASTGEPSNKRQKINLGPSKPSGRTSSTSPYSLRSRAHAAAGSSSTSSKMTGIKSIESDARSSARSSYTKPKASSKPKLTSTGGSTISSSNARQLECSDESGHENDKDDVHMSDLSDLDDPDVSTKHSAGNKQEANDGVVEESANDDAAAAHDEDEDSYIRDDELEELDDDEEDDDDMDDHDEVDDGPSRGADGLGTFADEEDEEDEEDDGDDGDRDDDGHGGSMFGLNLRAMAGYMSGLSTRFRNLLASLRKDDDPTSQMVALQDLSELLSVSTEDTLAGYFPTDSFVKELVYIMGGPKPERSDLGGKSAKIQPVDDDVDDEMRAVLAAAAAAEMEDNGAKMLLACRCLANLIEAMPYAAHSVVAHGAITVLNSKLMEITFIDLAEQVLQTLEKVSQDYPSSIVKEGGLSAILQYLDFFNIHIQRTAMTAAANCCRKLTSESLSMVKDVIPIIQNVLTYSDQRLVESACKCVVRVVDSYRANPELLEQLLTSELLAALNNLLLPASSSTSSNTSLGASVYTDVLKALGTACRSSPRLAVVLLENNIVETLYHLLTGSPAPNDSASAKERADLTRPHGVKLESEHGSGHDSAAETAAVAVVPEATGSAVAVADMAVLQNLAQRPKEQIQEALSLVGELLPPLPRDGVFDPRAYTEKAYLGRTIKRETRSSSAARLQDEGDKAASDAHDSSTGSARPSTSRSSSTRSKLSRTRPDKEVQREAAQAKRIEMLQTRTALVKRFTHLVLPTLVEVYAASVALHVRHKAINGILKIISFVDPESLGEALDNVPLASFLAAILSSRDHATLVNGALQIVELLTDKLPSLYTALLRREGVVWEIEDIASQTPSRPASADKSKHAAADSDQPLSPPRVGAVEATLEAGGMDMSSGSSLARLIAAASGSSQGAALVDALGNRTTSSSSASAFNAQSSAEASDASIWRARVLRDKFSAEAKSSEGAQSAAQALDHIKDLVKRLYAAVSEGRESEARDVLQQVASLFSRSEDPISSFELLRSGLVESLYSFATLSEGGIPLEQRRSLLTSTLMHMDVESSQSGATVLVRRLQEALSRLENVEITTALSGGSDEVIRKSPSAMLGRQLRLRLQAEDATDVPRSCNNIIVTIHAVATFQSLSDYLRPKIAVSSAASGSRTGAAAGSSASSRLSSVLAAFAAATGSGGFPELGSSKDAGASSSTGDQPTAEASKDAGKSKSDETGGSSSKVVDTTAGKDETTEGDKKADDKPGETASESAAGKSRETEAREEARALARHLFDEEERPAGAADTEGKAKHSANANGEELKSDEALARSLMDDLLHGAEFEDDEGFTDEEGFDGEILQSEIPAEGANGVAAGLGPLDGTDAADKTINLDVEKEGGRIVAKTPEGTRIATPGNGAGTPTPKPSDSSAAGNSAKDSSSFTSSPAKPSSYASALQKKPTDWHLEFSIGSEKLSLDTTIYGAVHRFETTQGQASTNAVSTLHGGSRHIWSNVYTVKYKKVPGANAKQAAEATPEPTCAENAAVELPASIKEDAPYAKLLQLLAVLHSLNMEWREVSRAGADGADSDAGKVAAAASASASALAESAFVNNKLTAKLNRQLEEPLIVASACLPAWSTDLPKYFPFLFPFEARFAFLQSTSFGYARLLTRWQALHSRNQESGSSSSSRLDDSFGFLGRLQRQKVRISRGNLLASAFKVFELYGSNSSVLEVEYFEEVGTGLGPTLEFYSLVSKEFARRDLKLWRDSRAGGSDEDGSQYVFSPLGLFPAPLITIGTDDQEAKAADSEISDASGSAQKRLQAFRVLGQFVAKALLDSRIIDCNFSPIFMRAVLNQHVAPTLATLSAVDAMLARSLASMRQMKPDEVESLGLDFTLPGYESIELHAGGREENVTGDNVERYISEVLDMTLGKGIRAAVRAFRQGFNIILPMAAMSSFTVDELVMLFGNTEEDWSETTLLASVKPDHGMNADSPAFRDMIGIMASFNVGERREFLQWLTGSPKLPIGGFSGLHPQLTIVKRPHEAPLTPDDYLPSVMTCVNYLKMPNYSSRDKMRQRLQTAMKEGSTSFHLS